MEQTSTNLSHVSTATEQMTSTIDEIVAVDGNQGYCKKHCRGLDRRSGR